MLQAVVHIMSDVAGCGANQSDVAGYGAGSGFYHEGCCWLWCISGMTLQAVVHIMSDF